MSWPEVKLGDLVDMQYGYTASAQDEPVGPKFLRITDIVSDIINWDTVPHCEIDENDYEKHKLFKGNIVVARTGATAGYAKLIRENDKEAVFASYLIRIRPNVDGVAPEFLGRLIESDLFT